MGYRIDYRPMRKVRNLPLKYSGLCALTGLFFLLFLILTNLYWQKGWDTMILFLPRQLTGNFFEKLDAFCMQLKDSGNMVQSVSSFWQSLLYDLY
ncbi:MAG: hypothetical protein J6V25_00800 [Oscillospiraceae bacterium]|nr:hypothetical protein [Oscillospiraceae bacterium]